MASVQKTELLASTALTASLDGSGKALEPHQINPVGWLDVSVNDGSTTIDCDIEHSADGSNWVVVGSFTQVVNTVSRQELQITKNLLPFVRASITLAGTPAATVAVSLYHSIRK